MKTKLSSRFFAALTIFSLMGQIAWVVENMYFNVFIYKMFNASAADISAMVAASAACATLTTVFIGALSDKIGKRKLFICLGYILWGVSIFAFVFLREDTIGKMFPMAASAASVGISLAIILDCLMTFFGSSANDAAFNAWLTDSTDSSNRGTAEGINAMMPLVAILCVFGGFMFFDLEKAESWSLIFTIIGVLVFVIGILGFFIIKEPEVKPSGEPYLKSIFYGFRVSTIKENPTLYTSLAAFIIFNISIQIFMPYLIIYYEVSLGMKDYVLIMAPAIIIASVVTALWGKVYDKKGFTFSGLIALAALILGYIVLFFTRTTLPVFIGSLFMMSGYLAGMAVFGAMIRDNTPAGKSGMLQGVRIFSQVLVPGIIGPYIGKTILADAETIVGGDGTESFVPNANIFMGALIFAIILLPLMLVIKRTVKPPFIHLETPFEKDMEEIPHSKYPRPQLRRDSYICLNGKWDFTVAPNKKEPLPLGEILVPFPPESRLSGICRTIGKNEVMWYDRKFTVPEGFKRDKVLLHFGAVDQYCAVFVNGEKAGTNVGGYLPFTLDITELLADGENSLHVEVFDPLDRELPYGKQTDKRGGMWYTKTSGIWQTVWLESVARNYISSLEIIPALDSVKIKVFGGEGEKEICIDGMSPVRFTGDEIEIKIDEPKNWTPQEPYIYNFTLTSGEDKVESYFALRTVEIKDGIICLNGKPYFFHGLLDQGYYPDGIFMPATVEGFKNDILKMKECGFNMLRKHIKVEPDIFYYLCDTLGMAVFQDFVNSGKYSFMIDTALPTVLPSVRESDFSHSVTKRRREEFMKCSEGIVNALYNHPSVVYYTIFNEGWGQFDAADCYKHFKALDPTRVYDTTSGWFKAESDVESDHVYFKPVKLVKKEGKPMVLSEFGGYVCKIEGHSANPRDTYGYKFFKNEEEFEAALISLYENEVIPHIEKGLSAAVLTQVSDVEDETNGLMTYDRKILKVDPEKMTSLAEKLGEAYAKINV